MKNYIFSFCVFLFSSIAIGQTPDQHSAERETLKALASRYEQAINDGNLSSLKDMIHPDATAVFVTGHECKGLEEMNTYYQSIREKLGAGSSYQVKLKPDHTQFFQNVAIAHGASDESVHFSNGKNISYQSEWTAVLVKENDQWKAVRLHVSMDPIDNPFVKMKNTMLPWIYGIAGFFIAVLGCWLFRKKCKS